MAIKRFCRVVYRTDLRMVATAADLETINIEMANHVAHYVRPRILYFLLTALTAHTMRARHEFPMELTKRKFNLPKTYKKAVFGHTIA